MTPPPQAVPTPPTAGALRLRAAGARLDLYQRPALPGDAGRLRRVVWYACDALLLRGPVPGDRWRRALLRLFGAAVGRGVVVKPRVGVRAPWFLAVGDHAWIGEGVWIDNHCPVTLGAHACVSQGAYLFTGNHDHDDERFRFFARPVTVGEGAWVGARAVVCPGAVLGPGAVVGAGVVARGAVPERVVLRPPAPIVAVSAGGADRDGGR